MGIHEHSRAFMGIQGLSRPFKAFAGVCLRVQACLCGLFWAGVVRLERRVRADFCGGQAWAGGLAWVGRRAFAGRQGHS